MRRRTTLKKATLALFIAAFGYCIPAQAQSTTEELILQSPGVHSERNLDAIISELKALNGITYLGFCENQNVIFLRVDRRKHPTDKLILEAFVQKKLEIHIKTGATIEQAIASCPKVVLPNGQQAPDPTSVSGSE